MDSETKDKNCFTPACPGPGSRNSNDRLNLSGTRKKKRRVRCKLNRSGAGGAISIQRQTLRANNRALAKSLQQYKQELNHANNLILELNHEKQALQIKYNALSRVAELKNAEIEEEVQKRIENTLAQMKELFSRISNSAGQGIDTCIWGLSTRNSVSIDASRSSLDPDKVEMSPETLKNALQRSIYSNPSTRETQGRMFTGSKPGDLSLVDEAGALMFEETSGDLPTVSELDELKRRSSSRQSKGRRSNLFDSETIQNVVVTGPKTSVEIPVALTPRTSDDQRMAENTDSANVIVVNQERVEPNVESSSQNPNDRNESVIPPPNPSTRNPILDPDERPLDVTGGRPAKATFTFIAFENEKQGVGNPAVNQARKKKQAAVPTKEKSSSKLGSKKDKSCSESKVGSKDVELDGQDKVKEVTNDKSDLGRIAATGEETVTREETVTMEETVTTEAEEAVSASSIAVEETDDMKRSRRGTFFVPKDGDTREPKAVSSETPEVVTNRRETFAVTKSSQNQRGLTEARRGTFAVTKPDEGSTGCKDVPLPSIVITNASEVDDSFGLLSNTILEEVDMEFTCEVGSFMSKPIEIGVSPSQIKDMDQENDQTSKLQESTGKRDLPQDTHHTEKEESKGDDVEMSGTVPSGGGDVNDVDLREDKTRPVSPQGSSHHHCQEEPSKGNESSDEGKKDKKFALFHFKPGKIKFVAGRRDANGDFKIPNLRSKPRSRSKNKRSRSKQKSKPIELPTSIPPSAFDFIGLSPAKEQTKGVFDISANESVHNVHATLNAYREENEKHGKLKKNKAGDVSSEESRRTEGGLEISKHSLDKRSGRKSAKEPVSKQDAAVSGCIEKSQAKGARTKSWIPRKKMANSTSEASSTEDEDYAPTEKGKSSLKPAPRTQRRTVTIAAAGSNNDEDTNSMVDDKKDEDYAPTGTRKSTLKPATKTRRETVTFAAARKSSLKPASATKTRRQTVTFATAAVSDNDDESTVDDRDEDYVPTGTRKSCLKPATRTRTQTVTFAAAAGSEDDDDDDKADEDYAPTLTRKSSLKPAYRPRRETVTITAAGSDDDEKSVKVTKTDKRTSKRSKGKKEHSMPKTGSQPIPDDVNAVTTSRQDDDDESIEKRTCSKQKEMNDACPPMVGKSLDDCVADAGDRSLKEAQGKRRLNLDQPAGTDDGKKLKETKTSLESCEHLSDRVGDDDGRSVELMSEENTRPENECLSLDVAASDDTFGDVSNFWEKSALVKAVEGVDIEKTTQIDSPTESQTKTKEHKGKKTQRSRLASSEDREGSPRSGNTEKPDDNECDLGDNGPTNEEQSAVGRETQEADKKMKKRERTSQTRGRERPAKVPSNQNVAPEKMEGEEHVEQESPVIRKNKPHTMTRAPLEDLEMNSPGVVKERRAFRRQNVEIEENDSEELPAKRARRNRGTVSYKEQNLNTKMRQGYKMTGIKYDYGMGPSSESVKSRKKHGK